MNKISRQRHSIRLNHYDYAQSGAYFITICSYNRELLFGNICGEKIYANQLGDIASLCWYEIPRHFPYVELDAFVLMPNHLHGILLIQTKKISSNSVGAQHAAPNKSILRKVEKGSLSAVIRSYKSAVSKLTREKELTSFVWQRNYYERIIRNEDEMNRMRTYIQNNPLQWMLDNENPNCFRRNPNYNDLI